MPDMKIQRLSINNVLAIEELDLDVSDGLVVKGVNGSGKTSILDALKLAFGDKARTELIHKGKERGEVLLVMEDGTEIRREITPEGMQRAQIKGPDGKKVATPQRFLDTIARALSFNPVQFLALPAKQQTKLLADAFPVDIPRDRIEAITRGLVALDEIDFDVNGLEVVDQVYKLAYKARTELNGEVKQTRSLLETERAKVPEGFNPEAVRNVSSADLADELSAIRRHNKQVEDVQTTLNQLGNKKEQLQAKIAELQAELAEVEKKEVRGREWLEQNPPKDAEVLEKRLQELDTQRQYLAAHDKTAEYTGLLTEAERNAQALDTVVKELGTLPSQLVREAQIPIEGLRVKDGQIFVDDLPLSNLSEGEQTRVAVQIAAAGAKELKLLCIDGAEKLSSDARTRLIQDVINAGMQVFMTEVSDADSLVIENVHGKALTSGQATPTPAEDVSAGQARAAETESSAGGGWFEPKPKDAGLGKWEAPPPTVPAAPAAEPAPDDAFGQITF